MENLIKYEQFIEIPLEERKKKAEQYKKNTPDKIPILLKNKNTTFQLKNIKFLIPKKYKILNLIKVIKDQNNFKAEDSLYVSSNNSIVNNNTLIEDLYSRNKSEDDFLYLEVTNMPAFGNYVIRE
jgi:hypothetical protein